MNLHGQIMNIRINEKKAREAFIEASSKIEFDEIVELAYKLGHRDARHEAAELALVAKEIV